MVNFFKRINAVPFLWPFILLFLISAFIPTLVKIPNTTYALDAAWEWSLGWAITQHLQFGTEYLFTYGPLGFLQNLFLYQSHNLWLLTAGTRLFLIVLTLTLFLRLTELHLKLSPVKNKYGEVFLYATSFVVAYFFLNIADVVTIMLFIALSLIALNIHRSSHFIDNIILGVILATAALIKSSMLVVALPLLFLTLLCSVFLKRRDLAVGSIISIIATCVTWIVFWIGAHQHFSNIVPYFKGSLEIINGYTPAMSIYGYHWQIICALLSIGVFAIIVINDLFKNNRAGFSLGLIASPIVFINWKEGFVRHDLAFVGHDISFFTAILGVFWILFLCRTTQDSNRRTSYIASVFLIFFFCFNYPNHLSKSSSTAFLDLRDTFNYATDKVYVITKQTELVQQFLKVYQLSATMINAIGSNTVAILPNDISMQRVYNFNLRFGPVPQLYSAYTSYLDNLNAQKLLRDNPENIIYAYSPIDSRYPLFDAPLVQRIVFNNYRFLMGDNNYALLKRKTTTLVLPPLLPLTASKDYPFNTPINLPSHIDKKVYATIEVQTSFIGKVVSFFYKPAPLYINFILSDGAKMGPFRFIYNTAPDGVLVSPFISNLRDIEKLASDLPLPAVSAIEISGGGEANLEYQQTIKVAFVSEAKSA